MAENIYHRHIIAYSYGNLRAEDRKLLKSRYNALPRLVCIDA